AHLAVLPAQDERALADDIHGEVVAGLRDVADMAGDLPVLAEDMLFLKIEQGGAMVTPARKSAPVPVVRNGYVADHLVHGVPLVLLNVHSIKTYFSLKWNRLRKDVVFRMA